MNFLPTDFAQYAVTFALLGGAIGIIAKSWSSIKSLFNTCYNFIITTAEFGDEYTANMVLGYLIATLKKGSSYERVYSSKHEHIKTGKYGIIAFEKFGAKRIIFWKGWWPILFTTKTEEAKANTTNISLWGDKDDKKTYVISFVRNTIDINAVIKVAAEKRNKTYWEDKDSGSRFFIKKVPPPELGHAGIRTSVGTGLAWYKREHINILNYDKNELGSPEDKSCCIDNLVYPSEISDVITEAIRWNKSSKWYKDHGIPWKRGWLLYGPPGTGKTALIRAIAQHLDMPLFVYSLGEMDNSQLQKSWEEMLTNTPCIALFEDFDNVFHGRVNIFNKPNIVHSTSDKSAESSAPTISTSPPGMGAKVSFDCLLNCIDGVSKSEGIFTIITTNNIEHIDSAMGTFFSASSGLKFMSTRPGRIDRAIEFTYIRREEKLKIAEKILSEYSVQWEEAKKLVDLTSNDKLSAAQWQDKCSQMALDAHWSK